MRTPLEVLEALWVQVARDDVALLASALAFRFFLALFPFFLFLAALSGVVVQLFEIQDPADKMLEIVGDLPGGVAGALHTELQTLLEERRPAALSIGVVGAILVSATGVSALMKGVNLAYDVEESRPLWQRALIAVAAAVLAGPLLVSAFVLLMYGDFIGRYVARAAGLEEVYALVVTVARWPALLGMLLLATAGIYHAAPSLRLRWRRVIPGAIAFTASWAGLTVLFSIYVDTFRTYGATYGTLASVAILLVWFYLTALLLLLGAELNAILDSSHSAHHKPHAARRAGRSPCGTVGSEAGGSHA